MNDRIILTCPYLGRLKNVIDYIIGHDMKSFVDGKYKNERDIMMMLSVNNIKNLLINFDVFNGNELEMLKFILHYYDSKRENEDYKDKISTILLHIDYNNINLGDLNSQETELLGEFENVESVMSNIRVVRERLFLLLECDKKTKEIIFKYYIKGGIIKIDEKDSKNIKKKAIESLLDVACTYEDVKILVVILIIIIDLKLDIKMSNGSDILLKLLNEYKNSTDSTLKLSIPKCLILFLNEGIFFIHFNRIIKYY